MKIDTMSGLGKNYVSNRVITGIAIFLFWLLLFILGMSVPASKLQTLNREKDIIWLNLLIYGLTFTPTNTAIMAAMSGILGGISSNLSAYNERKYLDVSDLDRNSFEYRSLIYMSEHPLVSMFRGFLAFLILVAGSYIANFSIPVDSDNPSQIIGMSASSYFKFAVTVSLLSYLVGYDPTQLQRLIGSLNVGGKKATEFEGHMRIKDGKHVTEGEFTGKATSTNQPADLSQKEVDSVAENTKSELNGKEKVKKESVS